MKIETKVDNWTANEIILGVVVVDGHEIVANWDTCTVYVDGRAFSFVSNAGRTRMRSMFDDAIERHSGQPSE